MSESDMIQLLLNQLSDIKSVKRVFMKKRDVTIYDETLNSISEQLTEYDVDIVTHTIAPNELNILVSLEKDFGQKYPNLKFNYSLIEADPQVSNKFSNPKAKLIYTSET